MITLTNTCTLNPDKILCNVHSPEVKVCFCLSHQVKYLPPSPAPRTRGHSNDKTNEEVEERSAWFHSTTCFRSYSAMKSTTGKAGKRVWLVATVGLAMHNSFSAWLTAARQDGCNYSAVTTCMQHINCTKKHRETLAQASVNTVTTKSTIVPLWVCGFERHCVISLGLAGFERLFSFFPPKLARLSIRYNEGTWKPN